MSLRLVKNPCSITGEEIDPECVCTECGKEFSPAGFNAELRLCRNCDAGQLSACCPACQEAVAKTWNECPACETALEPVHDAVFCPLCRAAVKSHWVKCPQCKFPQGGFVSGVRRILETSLPQLLEQTIPGLMAEKIGDASRFLAAEHQKIGELEAALAEAKSLAARAEEFRQARDRAEARLKELQGRRLTIAERMEQAGYRDNGDGTVTQLGTGLVWMRYPFGCLWEQGDAIGEPSRFTFDEAKQQATLLNARNFLGRSRWRLPDSDELESLLVRSNRPMVNTTVFRRFPSVPQSRFWGDREDDVRRYWNISFYTGTSGFSNGVNYVLFCFG